MLELKPLKQPMPVGVRLPEIQADRRIYYQLDLHLLSTPTIVYT